MSLDLNLTLEHWDRHVERETYKKRNCDIFTILNNYTSGKLKYPQHANLLFSNQALHYNENLQWVTRTLIGGLKTSTRDNLVIIIKVAFIFYE